MTKTDEQRLREIVMTIARLRILYAELGETKLDIRRQMNSLAEVERRVLLRLKIMSEAAKLAEPAMSSEPPRIRDD